MRPPAHQQGSSFSPWIDVELPSTNPLSANLTAEIVVVGAGITGLSVAYELAKRGHGVTVLESGDIGGGQTGRTTAHLSCALDDRFAELERLHGHRGAELAAQSHRAAIDRIEAIAASEQIDCDFERLDGFLFLAPGDRPKLLELELHAARRCGLEVEWLENLPVPLGAGPALRFARQAQFHPMKYLVGLTRALQALGGQVFTRTHVEEIYGGPPSTVRARNGLTVRADVVVMATNVPVNDRAVIHTKQAPYRSYVIAAPLLPADAMHLPRGLYWDTADPYHYVRIARVDGQQLLLVGGEDHKTGQDERPEHRWVALEDWIRSRVPFLQPVEHRWSGQVIEPVDGLAFIGKNPLDAGRVYIATGDSGHGMTHGVLAGMLLADLIEGRKNPWAELYEPRRRTLRTAGEYARENVNTLAQYADWLQTGDVKSVADIPPGSGAVLRNGLQLVAASVDRDGVVHACSAVCPHLAGVVRWNSAESTWDCPCHGSRFDAKGRVIEGPANEDLRPYSVSALRKSASRPVAPPTQRAPGR